MKEKDATRLDEIRAKLDKDYSDEQLDQIDGPVFKDIPEDASRDDKLDVLTLFTFEQEKRDAENLKTALDLAEALLKKGAFAKAEKVVKSLDPEKVPEDLPKRIEKARTDKRKKADAQDKKKKGKKTRAKISKAVTHASILDSLEKLDADLVQLESQQRNIHKSWRHVFFTRRRLEVIRHNFKRSCKGHV